MMTWYGKAVPTPVEVIQKPILPLNEQILNAIDIPTLILWVLMATICMSLWVWLYIQVEEEDEDTTVKDKIKLNASPKRVSLSRCSWDMLQK